MATPTGKKVLNLSVTVLVPEAMTEAVYMEHLLKAEILLNEKSEIRFHFETATERKA